MNENPNLSVLIDPDVFNASIISANDLKGDSKSEKGKMTNGQMVKNTSKKDNVNVESALEGDLKSVKGKITKGQMIKNGRSNKDNINVKRVTRSRTPKNYSEASDKDFSSDSEQEFLPERCVDSEDDDDYREQPKKSKGGRPLGSLNKKSRKIQLILDDTVNDGENESEIDEIRQISDEGESGCKSPAKKSSKRTKKRLVNKENG